MTRQTIFITGAASGIGKATALQFFKRGWFVGATDVDEAGLQALKTELNHDCFTSYLDVRDKVAFDKVMAGFANAAANRLDIMFNNAGIAVFGFLDEVPFEKVIDTVNINLIGVLNGNCICFITTLVSCGFAPSIFRVSFNISR